MVGELQWGIAQEVGMKVSCGIGHKKSMGGGGRAVFLWYRHKGIMVGGGRAAVGYTYKCVDFPISQMQWLVEEIIITFLKC